MPKCPGCNTEVVRLVRHHWHNSDDQVEVKLICDVCNRVLGPEECYNTWRQQKSFLDSYYSANSREDAETQVFDLLRERGETDKRVSAYLREHSVDVVQLYRYIDRIGTRVRNESWRSHGLTPGERRLLGRLRKHPRRNKERIAELLYNGVMGTEVRTTERLNFLMRRFFGFGDDSPTAREFRRFHMWRERSNTSHRALYEHVKAVRTYMREHPEAVTRVVEKHELEVKHNDQ